MTNRTRPRARWAEGGHLGVDHEAPAAGAGLDDGVLDGDAVKGQPLDAPLTHGDGLRQALQRERVVHWQVLRLALRHPLLASGAAGHGPNEPDLVRSLRALRSNAEENGENAEESSWEHWLQNICFHVAAPRPKPV